MTEDLLTWLRAQLDDDEEGARNAEEQHWRPDGANSCQVYAVRADLSTRTIAWCRNGYEDDFANSLHIARHDPVRILAEVEAKRRILQEAWTGIEDLAANIEEVRPDDCGARELRDDLVRLLALPYADRPGYRPEWAPNG